MADSSRDPFPASDFDPWAETYDQDVVTCSVFPFAGYEQVLKRVVTLADARPGMDVLDLGAGTGNLAARFAEQGCNLWCTDFSESMLAKAQAKLPQAHFIQHDLRDPWPAELDRRFDCIVSGYVFHHFELDQKVGLCRELIQKCLMPKGKLVVADLSFPSLAAMQEFAKGIPDWEEEFYWLADESIETLKAAELNVTYEQVSACAGIYFFQ